MLFSENDGKDISEHMLVFGPGELFAQSAADPHSLLMRRIEGFYVLGLHLPLDPLCAVVCFVRRQNGALDGRGFHHTSDRFAAHPNKFTDRFIALVLADDPDARVRRGAEYLTHADSDVEVKRIFAGRFQLVGFQLAVCVFDLGQIAALDIPR